MRSCPNCGKTFDESTSFCPSDGAKLADSRPGPGGEGADPFVGRMLGGRYRLERRLGAGGMGAVYRALHVLMEKPVAVKLLRAELSADELAVARFQREAKGASRIEHENCVAVTDFGREDDGVLWLVMEHLEGRTLWELIHDEGPLSRTQILDLAMQVCRGLVAAHAVGVVHRDLKPENVMVVRRPDRPDHVKVLDFGLAKIVQEDGEAASTALTRAGAVFGTPRYMSPEQAEGRPVDARSDLYSFGVILYEMVTGTLPFDDDSVVALLQKHVSDTPQSPSERAPDRRIDPKIEAIILQCMQKEPERRHFDARGLLADLERVAPRSAASAPQPSMPPTGELVALVRPAARRRFVLGLGLAVGGAAVGVAALLVQGVDPTTSEAPSSSRVPAAAVPARPEPGDADSRGSAAATPPAPAPAEVAPATSTAAGDPARTRRPKARDGAGATRRAPAAAPAELPPPAADPEDLPIRAGDRPPSPPLAPPELSPAPAGPARPAGAGGAPPAPSARTAPPKVAVSAGPPPGDQAAGPGAGARAGVTGDPYLDGLALLKAGDADAAFRLLSEAVKERPTDPARHLAMSDVYLAKGDLPVARRAAKTALRLNPAYVPAMNRLGVILLREGNLPAARIQFRTVLEFKPGDATALKYLDSLK